MAAAAGGLTLFAGMTLLYAIWDGSWWIYAILFLVPDLSFAGYLAGPTVGAVVYNAAHSYLAPVALMTSGFVASSPLTLSIAMIWLAHIGIDRALGYGLKYAEGFGFTHLGRIGKAPANCGNQRNPFCVRGLERHMKYGGSNMSGSNIARAGLLLASLTLAGSAQAASPLSPLAGSWSGGGTLSTTDGMQEQLRCRATYNVAGTGAELSLNLRCASQSYNFDLAGDVQYQGGAISGRWSETSRNASGTISGRANGDHIDAAARGDSFSANLSLTTRGGRQTVTIRPQGTNVAAVSLALNRR